MSETTETNEVAGYVPSAEAVRVGSLAAAKVIYGPAATADDALDEVKETTATLTAAVPVEVARLLGEVRALAKSIERGTARFMENYLDDGKGISTRMSGEAAAMIVAERSQITADLRAVLDTVGEPAPAPELFPGTRDQLGALGVRGAPAQVDEAATGGESDVEWVVNPHCAERFDEAGLHDYHPSCCRFPKSCSAWETKS